ncbi:peroxin, partial [Massospora cicadina]
MLQRVVEYYKRYKRPILVAGGAVTLTYLAAYYAKQKFIQFQDRAAKARAAKENLRRRFELNQVDAMDTILDLVKGLKEQFQLKLNHEELVSRITNLKPKKLSNPEVTDTRRGLVSPVETKLQLWEKLKILTFTEVLGSLYVIELLGMLIYIQMNLVGRLIYIESVVEEHSAVGAMKDANNSSTPLKASLDLTSSAAELSHEDKRAYFSFSWWFINRGWKSILEIIQSVVVQVVGSIPLKHRFTYNELVILFASLRAEIDHKLFSNPE